MMIIPILPLLDTNLADEQLICLEIRWHNATVIAVSNGDLG